MNYIKTEKYDKNFINENMMGPNSMVIIEELTNKLSLKKGMRVLDLGCGKGLTSFFIAKEFDVEVYAVDLWVSATENYERFKKIGMDKSIIPIHSNALDLPFANGFFDAFISIDAYHYFGNNNTYFVEKIMPLLKKDAPVIIAFPGMKYEVHNNIPKEMEKYWEAEALEMWHSIKWWTPKFNKYLKDFNIYELECFDKAWRDWLCCDNPYAIKDVDMIKTDNGRYMNIIGLTGKVL